MDSTHPKSSYGQLITPSLCSSNRTKKKINTEVMGQQTSSIPRKHCSE